ncbi:MAG TPA: pyrroline-5-carboxylate reductase [Candidatus Limnocylindrales bacterium]|nr:pyrroline-5-carboxylate reductase [Candidatus Limnocylindrales bacterium]
MADTIGFIGGGNMAEALVRGLLAAGHEAPAMMISEPVAQRRSFMRKRYGVPVTEDNAEVVAASNVVVLAVKPQILPQVLEALAPAAERTKLFVSIAAGFPLGRLQKALGKETRIVRVMPNTPCLVGKGASVLCAGPSAKASDVAKVRRLFAAVGEAHVVEDEKAMHAVTALSGSGPAYVYRFAEAMMMAGQKAGLSASLARSLTLATIAGAAEMMVQTRQDPADLRKAVSSPGGTTLAGLAVLEEADLPGTVAAAVRAAAKRSVELARS